MEVLLYSMDNFPFSVFFVCENIYSFVKCIKAYCNTRVDKASSDAGGFTRRNPSTIQSF